MDKLARQQQYWDQAATTKNFSHPFDLLKFKKLVGSNAHILDYGCGQGRLCNELVQAGFKNIAGVDYSDRMIREAQAKYPELHFSVTDGYRLSQDDKSFDAILLFAVLTCIPTNDAQQRLMVEITRVLKPGGLLVISDYPLQTDQRNLQRYEQFKDEFESYGIFQLSDGGIVRHHDKGWFPALLRDYTVTEAYDIDAKTMNGNPARIHQIWAKKITVNSLPDKPPEKN